MKLTYPTCTTVEGHPIEVGKEYESRCGVIFTVIAIFPNQWDSSYPVHAISEGTQDMFTDKGYMSLHQDTAYDLMRPSKPSIDYPWQDFPLAKWAAADKYYGEVWFYVNQPILDEGSWTSRGCAWKHPVFYLHTDISGEDSLRQRPEGV